MTLGASFHRYAVHSWFCLLVASPSPKDLLFCAKHLFVAAMAAIVSAQSPRCTTAPGPVGQGILQ